MSELETRAGISCLRAKGGCDAVAGTYPDVWGPRLHQEHNKQQIEIKTNS